MLKVRLLILLLIHVSVKSQAVFGNGITKLPPTYEISHDSFDPFINKVIHPPSFYLRSNNLKDEKYEPTQRTSFLRSKKLRKEEKYYKNLQNTQKSDTFAYFVSSEFESPMYNEEVNPLLSHSVKFDHMSQPTSLSTIDPSSTTPEDTTYKYALDALFSNNPITSPSFDTSSEAVPLNPLPLSIPSKDIADNFDDIKKYPIVTFHDLNPVLASSTIPPTSFTFTFENPYPINEEEKSESSLPPSTTAETATCDQDVCFDDNFNESEISNAAIIYPENYESSFPWSNDLLYSYIESSENLNYNTPTTHLESLETTINPTDQTSITSSTFLPGLSRTTWEPVSKNIGDPLNFQNESKATSNLEVIIVYPEGYSNSNIEKIKDATELYPERYGSFNEKPTQSEHPDINVLEINTTKSKPTISDELKNSSSNVLSNSETYSNLEHEFDNEANNLRSSERILTNQNELTRSYDYERNSFRMCKEENAFLDVGGNPRFYVECQDYQPTIKFCSREYNFNSNIKWPEYPCQKVFNDNKVSDL